MQSIIDLRIPVGLMNELKAGAKKDKVSVKAYALHVLAEAMRAKQ